MRFSSSDRYKINSIAQFSFVLDGFGFLETLEKLNGQFTKRFHIIVVSSTGGEMNRQRAFAHGNVTEYFVKPVLEEQLLQLTERLRFTQTG